MEIGFIGVGRMGQAMMGNLLKAGHRVRAWDISPRAIEAARNQGAEPATNARDALVGDAVISMLPNDEAMRGVFLADGFLPQGARFVHLNMATASVQCAKDLAAAHAERGIVYLSAPVFGRPEMAAERKLNVLAAGDPAAIARMAPIFDALAVKTWRLGDDPASANVAKVVGNLMVACIIEAMSEAAALARAHDVEPHEALGAIVGSLFDVPIFRIYAGLVAGGPFEPPGFDLRLALKDVKLVLAASEATNVPMPFASVLRDNYLDALAHGGEGKDWSIFSRVAARRAGLE